MWNFFAPHHAGVGCRLQRPRRSSLPGVSIGSTYQQKFLGRWGSTASLAIAAVLIAPAVSKGQPAGAAQGSVAQTKAQPTHKSEPRQAAVPATEVQMPVTPPAPPAPQWPVNDPPQQASVQWTGQGLTIDAKNSSLEQILNDIAAQSGAKVEGIGSDERVFGIYGPGQPRDVLSQLLEGTEYNVIMVGDGERGVPQRILLSEKPKGGIQPNAPVPAADEYEPPVTPYLPPQPPQPPPQQQPGMKQPAVPRTPQQILQEMQQREQQMREQQMQQMQQNNQR